MRPEYGQGLVESVLVAGAFAAAILLGLFLMKPFFEGPAPFDGPARRFTSTLPAAGAWEDHLGTRVPAKQHTGTSWLPRPSHRQQELPQ